jgi:hypothetical protein
LICRREVNDLVVPGLAHAAVQRLSLMKVGAKSAEWRAQIQSPARIGTVAERDNLIRLRDCFLIFYAAAIALVFAARGVRLINERRGGMIRLTYPDREIRVPKGLTVLELAIGIMCLMPMSVAERDDVRPAGFG